MICYKVTDAINGLFVFLDESSGAITFSDCPFDHPANRKPKKYTLTGQEEAIYRIIIDKNGGFASYTEIEAALIEKGYYSEYERGDAEKGQARFVKMTSEVFSRRMKNENGFDLTTAPGKKLLENSGKKYRIPSLKRCDETGMDWAEEDRAVQRTRKLKKPGAGNPGQGSARTSSIPGFLCVDKDFIAACSADPGDPEAEKIAFYNQKQPAKIVLKMLVKGLLVRSKEYASVCSLICAQARSASLVFLMANGGIGKTTLLCAAALTAYQNGCTVYYLEKDREVSFPDIMKKETVFIVDDAADHQEMIEQLHTRYGGNKQVHILMGDRIHKANALIEQLEDMIPDLIVNGKAIILTRNEDAPITNLLRKNITVQSLSNELIRQISAEVIAYRIKGEELDPNVRIQMRYNRRTITDAVLDYFVQYNQIADSRPAAIKKHVFDWDVWNSVPGLKGTFKYVAALNGCGVQASTQLFEKVTGSGDALLQAVVNGMLPIVQISDAGMIQLRHDTIADDYFKVTKASPYDAMISMIESGSMDDQTIIRLERKLFSLSNVKNPPAELNAYRILELFQAFQKKPPFLEVLRQYRRIHSLELARLLHDGLSLPEGDRDRYLQAKAGKSFQSIVSDYPNNVFIWFKYFNFLSRTAPHLPEEMLSYLTREAGFYKKATNIVSNYLKRHGPWLPAAEKHYTNSLAADLFEWIIEKIDRSDIPSRIMLSRIYLEQGNFEKARNARNEIANIQPHTYSVKARIGIISTYVEEVKTIARARDETWDLKVRILNKFIWDSYDQLLRDCPASPETLEDRLSIVQNYARFLTNKQNYDVAYDLLIDACREFEKEYPSFPLFRIHTELGMICQQNKHWNSHFDLTEAEAWFRKALASDCKGNDRLYALKPLCKTELMLKRFDECKKLCAEIFQLTPKDEENLILLLEACRLQSIQTRNLPVGSPYRGPRLSRQELTDEILRLRSALTEEQRAYAAALDLDGGSLAQDAQATVFQALYRISRNLPLGIQQRNKIHIAWNRRNALFHQYLKKTGME